MLKCNVSQCWLILALPVWLNLVAFRKVWMEEIKQDIESLKWHEFIPNFPYRNDGIVVVVDVVRSYIQYVNCSFSYLSNYRHFKYFYSAKDRQLYCSINYLFIKCTSAFLILYISGLVISHHDCLYEMLLSFQHHGIK